MNAKDKAPSPGQRVVLSKGLPGPPPEDQQAIIEVVTVVIVDVVVASRH